MLYLLTLLGLYRAPVAPTPVPTRRVLVATMDRDTRVAMKAWTAR